MGLLCSMLRARATDGQLDRTVYKKVIEQWIRVMTGGAPASGEAPTMTSSPIKSYSATMSVSVTDVPTWALGDFTGLSLCVHCSSTLPFHSFFILSFLFPPHSLCFFFSLLPPSFSPSPHCIPSPSPSPSSPLPICSSKQAGTTSLHKDFTSTVTRALKQMVVLAHSQIHCE